MLLARLLTGPVDAAARGLLGCLVSANGVTVRLTEVEAYAGVGADEASHAHRGQTRRNASMFGPPGLAYVYFVFGMHWCLNVVCGQSGEAAAVLLRAGEVVGGLATARERRGSCRDRDLARGPARLTRALDIDGRYDGTPLLDGAGPIRLSRPASPADRDRDRDCGPAVLRSGPRVGVSGAVQRPWRFWVAGEPSVSAYRGIGSTMAGDTSPAR